MIQDATLLLGSTNKGKIREFQQLLQGKTLLTVPQNLLTPKETANSFEKNALLKAKAYATQTQTITLADDSGFCVKALGHKPGLLSAQWIQQAGSSEKACEKIHQDLNSLKHTTTHAYFKTALVLFYPNTQQAFTFTGSVHGHIIWPPKGRNGFGYDPIFTPHKQNKTFAQMTQQQKNTLSHRAAAVAKLIQFLSLYPLNTIPPKSTPSQIQF